jgi:hypothetical protein
VAIRATISIELLQASVSAARTTTSVTYELSHATGIWTDPDSNNRMPKDEFPLSDVRFSLVEKNLSDNVPLVDVSAYDFSALKEDSFTFADTFTVAYHHSFTDAFTLDDLSQIDKDFYGNKGNVAFMLDIIGLTYNKVFTDSYTVGDVVSVVNTFKREFTDTFKIYDENPNALNVNLLNSQAMNAQDTSFLNDSGLGKGDALGFSEITAFVHSKGLTDSAIVVDSSSVSLNKPKTDSFGMSDNNVVASGVNPSDSISFSDSHDRTLSKALSDAFALDDSALINKDFTGNKGNVFGFSDVFGVQLEKTLSDTFKIYDENPNALNVNLLNSQAMNAQDTSFLVDRGLDKGDALGFSEITAFNHAKVLSDLATFNDDYGVQLEKTLSDSFTLDDSALIDKDYFGNKGNIVGVSDQVTVDYYYGGLVGQRPLNTMSLN